MCKCQGSPVFEVLSRLDFMPAIVFSTAYDQFALRAFEINAVDYLLKPYERERFAQAVRRALERKGRINLDSFQGLLRQTTTQDRFLVRVGRQIVPVATEDILWIEAAGTTPSCTSPTAATCAAQG